MVFGVVDAPKLNPPAAGIGFAASKGGAAVAGDAKRVIGAAGLPNENDGKDVDVGTGFSGCFVTGKLFTFVSGFEAIEGDVVVNVAPKENPPRRGTDSLDVTVLVFSPIVIGAVVVAFIANEIVGLAGSLNVGNGVLFGNASALLATGVDLIASDTPVTGIAMLGPFFGVSGAVMADGKLRTDVVVAVLNVTVVLSPLLNEAVLAAMTIGVSFAFVLSALAPLSTSSRESLSFRQLNSIFNLSRAPDPSLLILKMVDVLVFGFTNEMRLSSNSSDLSK